MNILSFNPRVYDWRFHGWKVKTYSKWNWKSFCCFRTISGHLFSNCMNIFHKTEVQKVILRCLTGLYLIWFKSYDTKCSMRPNAILAKSKTLHKNLQLINGRFTTIFGHFFANCMNIFHKTEVQTVIFRCLTGLNLNWFKSYDTKCKKNKNAKNTIEFFLTKLQKNGNGNVCILCHNFWAN